MVKIIFFKKKSKYYKINILVQDENLALKERIMSLEKKHTFERKETVKVELLRYRDIKMVTENVAGRIIIKDSLGGFFSKDTQIKNIKLNEVVTFEREKLTVEEKEDQPFYTSLLFIFSIFTFIVIGF